MSTEQLPHTVTAEQRGAVAEALFMQEASPEPGGNDACRGMWRRMLERTPVTEWHLAADAALAALGITVEPTP